MTGIYLANVLTSVFQYNIGAPSRVANVVHWQGQNHPWTVTQLGHVQTALNTAWGPAWASLAHTSNFYLGCIVIDSSANTGLQVDNATFTPLAGSIAGGPVGDQVAGLLSLHQVQRYKGGHGRLYIPGLSTNMTNSDGRSLTNAAVTALQTLWNNAVLAMAGVSSADGGPFTPVVWHKKQVGFVNTVSPVLSATGQTILATQRRRLRKVSRHRKAVSPPA